MTLSELIPVLQMAVGPVILISGVGLLLLSMTNRLGRVIDRTRLVAQAHRAAQESERGRFSSQLQMLRRRAALLRSAITLSAASVLFAALLIITIFLLAIFGSNLGAPIVVLFLASMILLIASLVVFILDLNLSLDAMNLDIQSE